MTLHGAAALQGRWIHSHEEDSAAEQVFRPPSYAFPPARKGRTAIELRPDGTYVEFTPGPADAPEEAARGRWAIDGERLMLGGDRPAWEIAAAEPDRLAIRR